MADDFSTQRIARLTPLGAVLARIDSSVEPVKPRTATLAAAAGRTLAADIVASALPPHAIVLRDGYAVMSDTVVDADPYSPVAFTAMPRRVDAGEPLPRGTDAVLPLDAIMLRGGRAEATAGVTTGEGVVFAGDDAGPQTPLRRAGERLRALDMAVIAAAKIGDVTVREPRIGIVRCSAAAPLVDTVYEMLVRTAAAAGTAVREARGLEAALTDEQADAIVTIGGTGSGRNDHVVQTLARLGRVEAHGIAVSPGETAAFGFVDKRPVLLIPGRLDATLAVWLLIGRHLIAKLAGGGVEDPQTLIPLKRKVASPIGMTELIPVRCDGGMAEPLASGYLSLTALARSDGWIVAPAGSEGFAAGTEVVVRPWP